MAQGPQGLATALCREPAAHDQESVAHDRAGCRGAGRASPTAGKASPKAARAGPGITLAPTVVGPSQLSTRMIVRVFFTLVALGVLLYTLYPSAPSSACC